MSYRVPYRKKMLHTNRKINDDDSLFSSKAKESSDRSSRRKPFNSTRFMTNDKTMFTGLTKAGTSGLAAFLSSGSHLVDGSIDTLDPKAGNSILTYLGTSLHSGALNQIDDLIETSNRNRSRQLRRRTIAGPQEAVKKP